MKAGENVIFHISYALPTSLKSLADKGLIMLNSADEV
jgi:hypothetical protein